MTVKSVGPSRNTLVTALHAHADAHRAHESASQAAHDEYERRWAQRVNALRQAADRAAQAAQSGQARP